MKTLMNIPVWPAAQETPRRAVATQGDMFAGPHSGRDGAADMHVQGPILRGAQTAPTSEDCPSAK